MATATDLPCDGAGVCMICKTKPPEEEALVCSTCATPWHFPCLSKTPVSLASVASWECPDCSPSANLTAAGDDHPSAGMAATAGMDGDLIASIRAIEADGSLTDQEKAKRRQELVSRGAPVVDSGADEKKRKSKGKCDVLDLLDEKFNCAFCMQLPDRPVTTPCGHNFCLKCFQKWVGQGKHTCAKCRAPIPQRMASLPRINSSIVVAIRMAKAAKPVPADGPAPLLHFIRNEDRPDQAYTTERAKKAGKANACSGQIFVTIPPDHFGPISKDYDPKFGQGVYVGRTWDDRMDCRQWGAHFPHVAGIAGQSDYGAQSVALSGGYEDDEDHGEWFLYTGSGGRDLSGNKRTNKEQSFDQKFEKLNEALRVSCRKGYPVRVVRSHKERRSSYAPVEGVRYDGVYRIEKCWRKVGIQGFKVCRYLFVRCDNDPAPWTSDLHGDCPRPLPAINELEHATDITERKESPAWDYDEGEGWKWTRPPPPSRKRLATQDPSERKRVMKAVRHAQNTSVRDRLLKEFSCLKCRNVMKLPVTTPCAHNFCKLCLLGAFEDLSFVRERTCEGGRTLRAQKIVNKCPCCPNDISEFLQNPQVNRELMDLIESLQKKNEQENVEDLSEEESDVVEKSSEKGSDHVGEMCEEGSDTVEDKRSIEEGNDGMNPPKSSDEGINGLEKLHGEESDGVKDKKVKAVTDDSVINTVNSEMEEVEEGGRIPVTKPNPPRAPNQKRIVGRKKVGKKAKKSVEGSTNLGDKSNGDEYDGTVDKKVEAVDGDSEVNAVNSEEEGFKDILPLEAKKDVLCYRKRKKPVGGTWSGVQTRSKKSKEASDDKFPSSTLQVQSDDGNFQ